MERRMVSSSKKQSKDAGLPPGALVFVGAKITENVSITITEYSDTRFEERKAVKLEECFLSCQDRETITWVHVSGLHEPEIIESIGNHYKIHSLILEDVLNTNHNPKIEDYEDVIFMVMKIFYHDSTAENIEFEQFSLILGSNLVLSFQEGNQDIFEPVRKRLRTGTGRIRKSGADYLAYVLADTAVDNYFIVTEAIEDRMEAVEEDLLTDLSQEALQEIHELKRDIIFLRRAVLPVRGLISKLEKTDSRLVSENTHVYLRDLYDHIIQVAETLETFREMATSLLEIYHSGVSNKMNEVMKVLTLIATIFIPLTFIAGIYGMNFKYMPELEWRWGYPLVWLIIVLVGIVMLIYFKKKKWL
jgi:magnesium transporter